MAHPDTEALAGLVLGADWADDDPQVALAVEQHVEQCAVCRRTVSELQHALTVAGTAGALEQPPAGLWDRIEADLDGVDGPDRELVTAGARRAGPASSAPPAGTAVVRPLRRRAVLWSAAAAVVGLGVGLGSGWVINRADAPRTPTATATTTSSTVASVPLDTLDTKQNLGQAALVRSSDGLDLRIATARLDPGAGYLEVWLLNRDGKRMVSVGVLGSGGSDTFPVAQSVIDNGFVTVDISREAFDENLQHSGDSLVRGTLGI
ncbi:anti-sigma factor domain-containing protein [Lapillicoccus jejuensis]|uniref:Anti-sigma-K factor rskA n=1 Tax=Lapillicoccus jejuensis TaxID=402171 RepID=A0A542E269_9MICO|nr:anti-sigma factor [Lapillicoccus jejuensis]TQJ09430.1 anti-sigma-K factor rskA [Lapillicoccus jejuensis]